MAPITCELCPRTLVAIDADRDVTHCSSVWTEIASGQRDAGLTGLRADTLLRNLQDDPRWNALLREIGLADDQLK
jgi:hypothetical protein